MITIRKATEADLPSMCELGEEVNALHHIKVPHLFAAPGLPERSLEHWKNSLISEKSAAFVALDGQKIVGFITTAVVDEKHVLMQPMRFGRINTVGVAAQMRGRGVGRQLMQSVHEWVENQGGTQLRLTVGSFNTGAIKLYEELGYEIESHNMIRTPSA